VDAVVVEDLRKSYGATRAVAGVSFTVRYGEIFSLLGPNGAGKTTVLEILEGYRQADAGKVVVAGFDPGDRRTGRQLREQIGPSYPIFRRSGFGDQITTLPFRNHSESASRTHTSLAIPYLHVVRAFSPPAVFSCLKRVSLPIL
jgi:ABC-type branched-subunit amino acid transport system ATPase component